MTKEVIVYGRSVPPCPFCETAKKTLTANNIEYTYKDIILPDNMEEFSILGVRTVPQITVDGENYGGSDNLKEVLSLFKEEGHKTALEWVVKSNGERVRFNPEKLNKKARWAAQRKVNWSSVALNALKRLSDGCKTRDVDKAIIDTCVEQFDEKGFLLAGRILAGTIYKEAYGGFDKIPTLIQHHNKMVLAGYWEELPYSTLEFEKLQGVIDHNKDLTYSYPEIKQINDKYVLRDRVKEVALESPQMMYMGMAMANMKNMPEDRRLEDVIKLYTYLSDKKICAPTPFMTNLRTPSRSYASCATFTTDDTADSLAAGDHIAYMLTCASAGIGAHINTRSKGDAVRGGTTIHQGKRPYYKMTESAVAANLQNSRGGSATMHVTVLDPEIMDILTWKNKKTATKVRVDGIHYSIGFNKLFAQKVQNKEDWMLVSLADNPELHEAMYKGDQEKFNTLYKEHEQNNPDVTKVDAGVIAVEMMVQGQESGQVYLHRTDELNRHTPHKDTIYSSNLCQETAFPTEGYEDVFALKSEDPNTKGEIGLCSLAAVVARRVSKEEWGEVAYYCTLMIDNVLDIMDYPFPHLKATAQARRNIGVGITDLAGHMAEKKLPYSSKEGKKYLHTLAELHMYSMIEASLRLAKERGVNLWSDKVKWADGWLPIDTMNKNVFKVVGQELLLDWEDLRSRVVANGGIRHSNLVNFMPNESSSIATNGTNSILPARSIKTVKTNGSKKTRFLVPNSDTLAEHYELAWDIKTIDMFDVYGIFQCFCDQSISADEYLDFTKGVIKGSDLVKGLLYLVAIGMKTRYYVNSKTNSGAAKIEETKDTGCAGGGCTI